MRLRRDGDEAGARRVWQALLAGFADVPAERPWVRRASKALEEEAPRKAAGPALSRQQALERAKQLEAEGKVDEARAIRNALAELYRDEPGGK
jgi:hypothetical protein